MKFLLDLIDNLYTLLGMIILVVLFVVAIPFVVLMEWLSGER